MSIAKHIIAVFEGERVPLDERDPRYFYYEIRHDEEWEPAIIEGKKVTVNFWGTLVSKTDLKPHMKDDCYTLTDEDIDALYEKIKM